jgi:hypothetical protein
MEFLVEGAMPEPQESDLRAYFHAHESSFLAEPTVSFRQVLVSDSRGSTAERDARVLLTKLIAAKSSDLEAGDPSLLPEHLESAPLSRVAYQFGQDFAQSLAHVELGQWTAPCARPTDTTWSLSPCSNRPICLASRTLRSGPTQWLVEHRAAHWMPNTESCWLGSGSG